MEDVTSLTFSSSKKRKSCWIISSDEEFDDPPLPIKKRPIRVQSQSLDSELDSETDCQPSVTCSMKDDGAIPVRANTHQPLDGSEVLVRWQ